MFLNKLITFLFVVILVAVCTTNIMDDFCMLLFNIHFQYDMSNNVLRINGTQWVKLNSKNKLKKFVPEVETSVTDGLAQADMRFLIRELVRGGQELY